MEYLTIIKKKAIRPIKHAYMSSNPLKFSIEFEDGVKVCVKDNNEGLRQFLCIAQHLEITPILGGTEHCTVSEIDKWALIGVRSGDAILFQNDKGERLPILFS